MSNVKLPNHPDNYMIPSGISVWFAPIQDDGTLCTPFDLGSASDISLALTDTYLEHKSARNGLMSEDKSVISEVQGEAKFTLSEMVGNNLLMALRPAVAPDTTAVYEVLEQKRFRLNATTARIIDALAAETSSTDYLELTDVVVRSADGLVTYTSGTDYTFTQAAGTGTGRTPATIARWATGSITDGAEIVVTYRYTREATSYLVQSGAILEGALWIQCLNLVGPLFAYYFPFVSVRIEGDTAINPGEFMTQAFTCKILTSGDGTRGEFYLFDRFQKLTVACT